MSDDAHVIAYDLSTKKTGVCLYSSAMLRLNRPPVTYVIATRKRGWTTMAQLIERDLSRWDSAGLDSPPVFAIEDVHMGVNAATLKSLARLSGAVHAAIADRWGWEAAIWYATTAETDSACGLSRGNRKQKTRRFAHLLGCADTITQDEADAVALAYWAVTLAENGRAT